MLLCPPFASHNSWVTIPSLLHYIKNPFPCPQKVSERDVSPFYFFMFLFKEVYSLPKYSEKVSKPAGNTHGDIPYAALLCLFVTQFFSPYQKQCKYKERSSLWIRLKVIKSCRNVINILIMHQRLVVAC